MKKRIGISLAILMQSMLALAQYIPMIEAGKYWIYVEYYTHDTPNLNSGFLLKLEGDTTIANQQYKKVIKQGLAGTHPCPPAGQPCFQFDIPYKTISSEIIGYAREDIGNKTSYFLPISNQYCDTLEYQLFDFSLETADTLNPCARYAIGGQGNSTYGIVDSVTNLFVYNLSRRTLNTTGYVTYIGLPYPGKIEISEGVGFLKYGLLHRDYNLYELVDFCEGTLAECNIVSSIDIAIKEQTVLVYPNPAEYEIRIETKQAIEQVQFLNTNGSVILSSIQSPVINIEKIPSGVYFLKVELEGGITKISKLIKI